MIERNKRNTLEQFTTCSHPFERNERNTPLWGVTVVRGVRLFETFFILLFDAEAMNANLPKYLRLMVINTQRQCQPDAAPRPSKDIQWK